MELGSLFLIFLLVSIALGGYEQGMLLFGDTDLTYHFGEFFFSFDKVYLWNDYFKAGIFDYDKFQAFYLKKVIFLINGFTDLYLFSYFWYFLPILLYGVTFYFLLKEIAKIYGREDALTKINILILSIFSFVNGIFILYYGQTLVILSLVALNVFLLYFTKNIFYINEYSRNNFSYLVVCGIFFSQISIYIHTLFLLLYAALILVILNYQFILKHFRTFLIQGVLLAGLAFALNAQWIFPVFIQSFINSTAVSDLVIYDPELGWDQAKSISKNIYMSDLLKTKPYHVFNDYPAIFNIFYFVPIGIVLFFLTRKGRKVSPFFLNFLIFLLVSLFLAYGVRPTSEMLYKFFWEHAPFFTAFRTVFKFSFLFMYGLIILLMHVLMKWKRGRSYTVVIALLALNILFSFFYYNQSEVKRTLQQYKIPEYYFELQAARLSETNKKIGNNITSPQFNWQFQYMWAPEKVDSMNILPYFYGPGFFINGAQDSPDVQYVYNDYFDYNFRNNQLDTLKNLLSIRNIKFITYQDDLRVSDNESTPHIVKSNLETSPLYEKVFSKKFVSEICSGVTAFDKLSICQVKNSLFAPLFQIKDPRPVEIKSQQYLSDLKGASYFIPYNNRSEKSYQQVNLVEENPIIINDLMRLGVTDTNDVRLFETRIQSSMDTFSPKKSVYASFKPFEVKNCYYQIGCNLFFFQDIKPGRYHIYYVRHLSSREVVENKEYSITIADQVPIDFIQQNVQNLETGEFIHDYREKEHSKTVNFKSKQMNDLGEVDFVGGNTVIRTLSDTFFSSGIFYLVRSEEDSAVSQSSAQIEFKKVNPTKFRVRIHNAKGTFPLVFSENFDKNWRIYNSSMPQPQINITNIEKYLPLWGNDNDQATKEELRDFVQRGMITDLGDLGEKRREHMIRKNNETVVGKVEKYTVDFISKNFGGVIQNNNLPDGKIWETWFQAPLLDNESHFENDGYSNGWVVDAEKICESGNRCIKNTDGTTDFELVVEFWPQRLFYLGLGISLLTAILSFIFVISPKKPSKSETERI